MKSMEKNNDVKHGFTFILTNVLLTCQLRDVRMRRDLEARYDHRLGAFDWDYAMNLCDIGVSKCHVFFFHLKLIVS